MDKEDIQMWNERHFQICLALISRPTTDVYGYSKPIVFEDIINKADRMVRLLKEREGRITTKNENCVEKVSK